MGYSIQQADLKEDKQNIMDFWKKSFPAWPQHKYDWFYKDNISGHAKCWTVKNKENDAIVGFTAIFPRKFKFNGQPLMAGISGDFGVDRKHRVLGPALQLQKAVINVIESENFDFLYGTPNKKSEPVIRRVGFKIAGTMVRMVKVLKADTYLSRILKSNLLSTLATPFANLYLKLSSPENKIQLNRSITGETVQHFDQRFDQLWEKSEGNFKLIGQRDSEFLNWRFRDCPYRDYKIFTAVEAENNHLVGYIVYHTDGDTVHISDCLAEDNENFLDALIANFIKYTRKQKFHSISMRYLGSQQIKPSFEKFGFSERADKINVVAYSSSDSSIAELLLDAENWYFFEADND